MKKTVKYYLCVFFAVIFAIGMAGCADNTEANDKNNPSEAQETLSPEEAADNTEPNDKNNPSEAQKTLSAEEALELLKEQLIIAYEKTYGEFTPSDEEPTTLTGDEERLSYVIPRLTVKEETEQYFIVPVIWDFYIDKETHEIYKFYNGIDTMFLPFDPEDPSALAFAG